MNKLGERIKKHRLSAGLTQKQLGKKLGFSEKVISKWENNISIPDVFTFSKMGKILDFC